MPDTSKYVASPPRSRLIGMYPFMLICVLPAVVVLGFVYADIVRNLFGIRNMAEDVRTAHLPSILHAQRTLVDIGNLRRYAEIVYSSGSADVRRRSRLIAHSLASKGMFSNDPDIVRGSRTVTKLIVELSRARDKVEEARASTHAAAFQLADSFGALTRFLDPAQAEAMRRSVPLQRGSLLEKDLFRPLIEQNFKQLTPVFAVCRRKPFGSQHHTGLPAPQPDPSFNPALNPELASLCDTFLINVEDVQVGWIRQYTAEDEAELIWSRLNSLLREASDAASTAEAREIYKSMSTIGREADRISVAFYVSFVVLAAVGCLLLFIFHRYVLSPIALAVRQLALIRAGSLAVGTGITGLRIRELAELLSLLPELRAHLAALKARSGNLEREKDHYEALSQRDGLTGALNRRSFDTRLANAKNDAAMAALMVDVDFFKHYNDTYGHQEGDACLIRLVRELETALRTTDDVYRYGGEEFIVLLPGASATDAARVAEMLRERIQALAIPHTTPIADVVTVSIGVATRGAQTPLTGEELVRRADTALYRAKADGRNRICADSAG